MKTDILIVGSGGREHALAWKLAQSPDAGRIFVAPGNGGTAERFTNVPIAVTDVTTLADFAAAQGIGLTVVGPETALAAGIVDHFTRRGLRIFGPSVAAARIETLKIFAAGLMRLANVSQPDFAVCACYEDAVTNLGLRGVPIVVKANGLAAGKGVTVCETMEQAHAALEKLMVRGVFGSAGDQVLLQKKLVGQEVSVHAICVGGRWLLLPMSRDYKTLNDGGMGQNTGGMGAVAPFETEYPVGWVGMMPLWLVATLHIIIPILEQMERCGHPFSGCLYPGLMLQEDGGVAVLECNARFGDPETQVLVRVVEDDWLPFLLQSAGVGSLKPIVSQRGSAVCVVLAAEGYPDTPKLGAKITGIDRARQVPGVEIFHAGTTWNDHELVVSGGRVLNVSAHGATAAEARERAYEAVACIRFEGMQYRTDIGL